MSNALTFSDAFRQVRERSAIAGEIVATGPSSALAVCGSGKSAITFTNESVEFWGRNDMPVKFGWAQLDFILPGDLSLASDKLHTFCDMEVPAARIANVVGTVFAWCAAALSAYFVWSILYALVIHPMIWLDKNLGTFGDILDIFYVVGIFAVFGWWLLAIVAGIFASGGAFSAFAHWLGRKFRPLIRFGLSQTYGQVENGLRVVNQDWVCMPWNPQSKRALDLIFIGVKLRRRGLA